MTALKLLEIWCNHPFCSESIRVNEYRVWVARSSTSDQGWTHRGHQDWCPLHARPIQDELPINVEERT